jgi:aerobic-type carbon monoxide dehydrogenase small subunit (CoxS/CutS family)
MRPIGRRVAEGVTRAAPFLITADGQAIEAYPGETVATALLAAGRRTARRTAHRGAPRGVFCAIGVCHDCRMIVDGETNVRTCLEPARAGMIVETQRGFGASPASDSSAG